jgi:predicted naringenin-chalcone synthase
MSRDESSAVIVGMGTALPTYSISQPDAATIAIELGLSERWSKSLAGLYRKTGVGKRSSVLLENDLVNPMERQSFYKHRSVTSNGPTTLERMQQFEAHASPLMEFACRKALGEASIAIQEITHLVTVSCTGFFAPGVEHRVIRNLGMKASVQRTHVGFMGCHGFINALRTAAALVESDKNACVLVGAVELCSLHQQYTDDAQQLVANAIFADGAASVVVRHREQSLEALFRIDSSLSWLIADSMDSMSWRIGDHGFKMTLSPEVPLLIERELRGPVEAWLTSENRNLKEILQWAIHPGGPRVVDSVVTALGLDDVQAEASRIVLNEHGNMSSPTVIFVLDRLRRSKNAASGSTMLTAFGPGLHAELMLLSRV